MKWLLFLCLCTTTLSYADSRYANGSYVGNIITLGVRDLSPRLSRFLETDPEHQFSSDYSYAGGTPVTVADPTGAVVLPIAEIRLIDDTRSLFRANFLTAEDTKKVAYVHTKTMPRSASLGEFFIGTQAAALHTTPILPSKPWHVASCEFCLGSSKSLSLKPYHEEVGTTFTRAGRDREMYGFSEYVDVGLQLWDDRALVLARDDMQLRYNRRMEFLANPEMMKARGISSPLADFRQEPDELFLALRKGADEMADRIVQYDTAIAKQKQQTTEYYEGLNLVRTRRSHAGYLFLAQRDPRVLRALHEEHRSLMPKPTPKPTTRRNHKSWLPWRR